MVVNDQSRYTLNRHVSGMRAGHGAERPDWLAVAEGFELLHFGIRSAAVDHSLRLSLGIRSGTTNFN